MKKYLFGLGTMLVGAGLMFVLMHGEVEAKDKQESYCEKITPKWVLGHPQPWETQLSYCKIKDLTCFFQIRGVSCVKN